MDNPTNRLTLDEETLAKLPDPRKQIFIYEWLQYLVKALPTIAKADIKEKQKKMVEQILLQIQQGSPGPPTRELLAAALATLFSVGDTFLLFESVNKCNDLLKSKDDSPSYLPSRLAATVVVGAMYEKLGRMMGRSYEETVQVLARGLKNAESQTRTETMVTFGKVCKGMGGAAHNVHKDIYKACKSCLTDRVMTVRVAAAGCLMEMLNHAPFLYTSELETLAGLCFRALDGASYTARLSVAKLLGSLVGHTQDLSTKKQGMLLTMGAAAAQAKTACGGKTAEEALGLLAQGFLRGGLASFLKAATSSSSVTPELRVGVSQAYVAFLNWLGPVWTERHLGLVLGHVLELAATSAARSAATHTELVYTRNCVAFILSALLGRQLREKAQLAACKELTAAVARSLNSSGEQLPGSGAGESVQESAQQHLQVCALQQLGYLCRRLGTLTTSLLTDLSLRLLDTVFSCLLTSSLSVRLAASDCLRQVCIAVPSVLTPLIDKCVEALETYKSAQEAVSGYSSGLSALLGAVRLTPNGIPHTRGKIIFNCGEELLRSASQNSRLCKERTRAGWLLIGAIMSLGGSVVKGLLPRCMLLWRNAFPRSQKDLESEKARGDAFTWLVSLEARAGALASMHSFITACPHLLTEDILRRLLLPIEAALNLLTLLSGAQSPVRSYGGQLRAPAATLRLRLLEVISALPTSGLESSYAALLRLLVAEITLADGAVTPTSTSLLMSLCMHEDSVLFGGEVQDQLDKFVEEQLQPNSAAGSGALEHDHCWLYRPEPEPALRLPLPLGVALIDQSVLVFGKVFPRAAAKHRFQMLQHFNDCLKTAKAARAEALQMNIFAALLAGFKGLVEDKAILGGKEAVAAATDLVAGQLVSPNALLRYAAADCMGRLAQVVGDHKVVTEMAQKSFDFLKSARDVASRTGHSFALGCLHRYVGSLGSGQHLHTSVSILLALAQDNASPLVQAWALNALALIANSGGPMFRGFVEPTLTCVLKLLLSTSLTQGDVLTCLGRLLQAVITTLGPELSVYDAGVATARSNILLATAIMQAGQPLVQAESIACLQQLHMFAPRQLDLPSLVPRLVRLLASPHLALRRAAIACLRQLVQRESREVCEIVLTSSSLSLKDTRSMEGILAYSDSGLPGILFSLLDQEEDTQVTRDVKQTLSSILSALAAENLSVWLSLCKEILTISVEGLEEGAREEREEVDEDDATFTRGEDTANQGTVQPRWATRVFAASCLRRIIAECCQGDRAHFDLSLAKEMSLSGGRSDFLVLHLTELVRMCFMAATADSDPLRLEGLETMQVVIEQFAATPEPEFPGHVILEQYQAQVGAALRPAFSSDTASHVTARACAVCSTWISSGVARDLNDLRRVYQLLVTSLSKLKKGSSSSCYNESASTLEKLSILKAWAEVYIVSMRSEHRNVMTAEDGDEDESFGDFSSTSGAPTTEGGGEEGNSLSCLVTAELPSLSKHWLAAIKDHALLSLSPEFKSQLPYEGGAFYTNDTIELARPHYRITWAPILHAAAVWLTHGGGFANVSAEKTELAAVTDSANIGLGPANATAQGLPPEEINRSRFHLLLGVGMEALCSPRAGELTAAQLGSCLSALAALLEAEEARRLLMAEAGIGVELCNVLHRQLLSQENTGIQQEILRVVGLVVRAAGEHLADLKRAKLKEIYPANQSITDIPAPVSLLGEGGEEGQLKPGTSTAFAVLEVCLCVLVRYYPDVSPRAAQSRSVIAMQARSRAKSGQGSRLTGEQQQLVASSLRLLASIPSLCSPAGAVTVSPSLLYLVTGVLQAAATKLAHCPDILADSPPVLAALEGLQILVSMRYPGFPALEEEYSLILQSGLVRILDLVKTAPDSENKLDEISLLEAIKVYILWGEPASLNDPAVKYPALNAFSSMLQSPSAEVRRRSVKILQQIFSLEKRESAVPYIQTAAPIVIRYLLTDQARTVKDENELGLNVDCLALVEILIKITDVTKRSQLVCVYLPLLMSLLLTEKEEAEGVTSLARSQHELVLAKLTAIGAQFPTEFKGILQEKSSLKARVERAVLGSQARQRALAAAASQSAAPRPTAPSITLKTDFSNFA